MLLFKEERRKGLRFGKERKMRWWWGERGKEGREEVVVGSALG